MGLRDDANRPAKSARHGPGSGTVRPACIISITAYRTQRATATYQQGVHSVGCGRRLLLGPIFNREFLTVPRRNRHYVLRVAYLGTLWIIAITAWLATLGWSGSPTLGQTAHLGQTLFQVLMFVQLALFLFFA